MSRHLIKFPHKYVIVLLVSWLARARPSLNTFLANRQVLFTNASAACKICYRDLQSGSLVVLDTDLLLSGNWKILSLDWLVKIWHGRKKKKEWRISQSSFVKNERAERDNIDLGIGVWLTSKRHTHATPAAALISLPLGTIQHLKELRNYFR